MNEQEDHLWQYHKNDLEEWEQCSDCYMIRIVFINKYWYYSGNWINYGRRLYTCSEEMMKNIFK